jgi:hypothetical protein
MTEPVQRKHVYGTDTGAAFKGPLTIMDIDTKDFKRNRYTNCILKKRDVIRILPIVVVLK